MTQSYDVIVVGAGPAGVCAAVSCKNEGLEVLLIDKKQHEKIGDKVCGEAISKRTIETVSEKLGIENPSGEEINACVKELVLRTSLPVDHIILPAIGYMVNRHIYGQRLLNDSIKKGVSVLADTKVIKPIIKEGKVTGVIARTQKKEEEEYFAKVVIDCSGLLAVIRTNLPDDFEPSLNNKLRKSDYAPCYREIIELDKEHDLDGKIVLQYEEIIPNPGYIWFFGDGERKINCGTGFIKIGKDKDKSVKSVYFNAMEKYYPKGTYQTIDGRGDSVPIRPPLWNAVAPGLIVAGDAAFHADPLTAEGHGPAMLAGLHAGEIAAEAIRKNRTDVEGLWEYNKRVIKSFGADHARSRILTLALQELGPKRLEFLLTRKVIKQADLTSEGVLKKQSIFSYLDRAIRSFPRFGLLLLIKKAISASKKTAYLCDRYPEKPNDFRVWREEMDKVYEELEK